MEFQTLNLLIRCNKEFNHEKLRMNDLSDTESMICSYIYSHNDCSQDEVATALKIDKTTVAKALITLENKNCVVRTQDLTDKRVKRLRITKQGHEKISNIMSVHNDWFSEVLKCLSKEEQKQFENYCERLLHAAEKLQKKAITEDINNA